MKELIRLGCRLMICSIRKKKEQKQVNFLTDHLLTGEEEGGGG